MAAVEKFVLCHWKNSGGWNSIEVGNPSQGGHDNHEFDIWPPIAGVTVGQNWPVGQSIYDNDCMDPLPMPTSTPLPPLPTLTPTPTPQPIVTSEPVPTVSVAPPVEQAPLANTGAATTTLFFLALIVFVLGLALWGRP